jgi:hypothetical protein
MKFICLFLQISILAAMAQNTSEIGTNEVDVTGIRYARNADGKQPKAMIAIDNVCAWPNLTVLGDGTIVAMIHNEPSHLRNPSDIECWASEDDGLTWQKRGTPAPRDNEKAARGNVAAGLTPNGDLVLICSGWSDPDAKDRGQLLPVIVCHSTDGGFTWEIDRDAFTEPWPEEARSKASPEGYLVPFGDIMQGDDGTLRAGLYSGAPGITCVYKSRDGGRTWGEPVVINPDKVIHEPALFHLGDGRWLCAARNDGEDEFGMDLYSSDDDANTWTWQRGLTPAKRLPGHFLRLQDGRIVLSYGNRWKKSKSGIARSVEVMISSDEGQSWSAPVRVAEFYRDGGYPSSVQLKDGQVLTVYYARESKGHKDYHMGAVIWDPEKTRFN